MLTIYAASWVLPAVSAPIADGAIAIEGSKIESVGYRTSLIQKYPEANLKSFDNCAIIPGLVNAHSHLELTAMRGYLEKEETDFFAWLRKLTIARLERMTADDIHVSAMWGACEALRAGVTCVADASDVAVMSGRAIKEVGLRGTVFQESFGPDARLVKENFEKLKTKIAELRDLESDLLRVGVSPHAPYTVCGEQLERIADYAQAESLPLMMHAAESAAEEALIRNGCGMFADGLAKRNIEWSTPGTSVIQYLQQRRILEAQPLLAHCIRVDENDLQTLAETKSKIAHCPKSNAKLGHGRAPFAAFLKQNIDVGLGSDSVASNNTCDILEEARFAALLGRMDAPISADQVFSAATIGGAQCLGLGGTIGQLSEEAAADLTVLSLGGVHQLPIYDPTVAAIFSASGRDVVMTVVAGKEVFKDGVIVNIDEERLRARMKEVQLKLNE
jgi:cytosine/adenosine deaminase-related metal-dependent hydrolase